MSAPKPQPTWRRTFDRVERAVGQPLESTVNSSGFVEWASHGIRVRNTVRRKVAGVIRGATGKALRAVNIPTLDDVQRLSRNLTVVASEVRALGLAQSSPAITAAPPVGTAAAAPPADPALNLLPADRQPPEAGTR